MRKWTQLASVAVVALIVIVGVWLQVRTPEEKVSVGPSSEDVPDAPPEKDAKATAKSLKSRLYEPLALGKRQTIYERVAKKAERGFTAQDLEEIALLTGYYREHLSPPFHSVCVAVLTDDFTSCGVVPESPSERARSVAAECLQSAAMTLVARPLLKGASTAEIQGVIDRHTGEVREMMQAFRRFNQGGDCSGLERWPIIQAFCSCLKKDCGTDSHQVSLSFSTLADAYKSRRYPIPVSPTPKTKQDFEIADANEYLDLVFAAPATGGKAYCDQRVLRLVGRILGVGSETSAP